MGELPTGTVTFLFTDIEGSTRLLEELGHERYAEALARHREILRRAFAERGGYEVNYEGDAFFVSFPSAAAAVGTAIAAQRGLAAEHWPEGCALRARMGIHTGEPLAVPPKYVGLDVHRAARIMAAGHGGQILLSERTAELVEEELPETASLRDLDEHRLKDLSRPQRLYQLVIKGLPSEFPPLKTFGNRATNLPAQPNRLIGRTEELAVVTGLLRDRKTRLLTLTGPGGTGKTRLALHAAAELVDEFADGVFVVFLASIRDPRLAVSTIAQTLGLREQLGRTLEEILRAHLGNRELLLILDNFEHMVDAAPAVALLLSDAPRVTVLATSREPLRLRAERCFGVLPLPTSDEWPRDALAALANDSVALLVERARAADDNFELTDESAGAVAAICVRLDGLPLALELAAARMRTLSPEALERRLDRALPLLSGGARDADERQQTLRATIAWSYELLSEEERIVFARLAVFVGGCALSDAEAICDANLDTLQSLVDKSLLRCRGERFLMLETIREYGREQLEQSGEADQLGRRHADFFLAFAERGEQGLHSEEQNQWLPRLEAEIGNLRAAQDWFHERDEIEPELRLLGSLVRFGRVGATFEKDGSCSTTPSLGGRRMQAPLWCARSAQQPGSRRCRASRICRRRGRPKGSRSRVGSAIRVKSSTAWPGLRSQG